MVLVEDTRNQIDKHKLLNDKLKKLGHLIVRSKLYVGDYARIDDMSVCIDTKKDWLELAGNICGKQHLRFREECIRAKEANIQLIVLVEEESNIDNWTSPKKKSGQEISKVSNETLAKAMITMSKKYGVKFINCPKEYTAELILNLLQKDGKEDGDYKR